MRESSNTDETSVNASETELVDEQLEGAAGGISDGTSNTMVLGEKRLDVVGLSHTTVSPRDAASGLMMSITAYGCG